MRVAVFNTKSYDRQFLEEANKEFGHEFKSFDTHLNLETYKFGFGYDVICGFVNDHFTREILTATRIHDGNFSLEGLLGFEIHGKTIGILGAGRIGSATAPSSTQMFN